MTDWLRRYLRALLRHLAAWGNSAVKTCARLFGALASVWGMIALDRWTSDGELLAWLSSEDLTLGQVGIVVMIAVLIVKDD